MPLRIGVLGCGNIARAAHLRSLAGLTEATVVAIADADPANLAAAQSLAPKARAVTNYDEVLSIPDVDAVIIALPPALHADAAVAALERGKHVYVEKPLATSVTEAERVVAAWRESGLTAMMGFNYRFNPMVQRARARLAAAAVGTVVAVRTVFATPRRAIPAWKQQRDMGGGALLDLAVHHVDLARFLLDTEIAQVTAELRSVASDQDTACLQLRLTNDVAVQCLCSLSAVDEDRIEIYGSAAKLTIDRYGSLRVEESPVTPRGALPLAVERLIGEVSAAPYALAKLRAPLHDPSFPAAMRAFVRAAETRQAATPSLGDGFRALAVIEAAELSARTRRTIEIELSPAPAATSEPRRNAAGV